jgi:alpha-methylacyl-CoA racemase
MPLPLQGLTVLDFSTLLPGPLATLFLAEAGAEVIKVERPGGEDMRRFPPRFGSGSAPFAALNAGKKSVIVDLKTKEGRAGLRPLIERADILVEQFRPGVMERFGLGYEAVRAINPRIVYCSITGYGQTGPRAQEAGHDINYQAVTGLLSLSPGTPDVPSVPAALVADIAGGTMPAVMNILLALRQRDLTEEGCYLDIAMADAMFTFAWYALTEGFSTGRFPGSQENMLTGGSPRYGLYTTADGRFLAVGALEAKFWDAFCEGIGLPPDLKDDRRDPEATRAAIVSIVKGRTGAAWTAVLAPLDCCATVVTSLQAAANDPQFRERGLFQAQAQDGTGQRLPIASLPIATILRRPLNEARDVPDVGEHTREVVPPFTPAPLPPEEGFSPASSISGRRR